MQGMAAAQGMHCILSSLPFPNRNLLSSLPSHSYKDVVEKKSVRNYKYSSKLSGIACTSNLGALPRLLCSNSSGGQKQLLHSFSSKGQFLHSSSVSSAFFGGDRVDLFHTVSRSPQRQRLVQPNAHRYSPYGFRYPEITEKPEWWWRTLACVPYLLALQLSDTGYYIMPLTERYEFLQNLIFYIPGAVNRLPVWFNMIYCFAAYLLVVKNKDWPHFFRFHLMMGMLFEVSLQVVWNVSNFMPLIHYNGTFRVQYWAVVAVAYITILLECVRCALAGKYADIPFINESAYIHTLFGTSLRIGGLGG